MRLFLAYYRLILNFLSLKLVSQLINFTDHYIKLLRLYREPLLLIVSIIPYLCFNTISHVVKAIEASQIIWEP